MRYRQQIASERKPASVRLTPFRAARRSLGFATLATALVVAALGTSLRSRPVARTQNIATQLLTQTEQTFDTGSGSWSLSVGPYGPVRDVAGAITGPYGMEWVASDKQYVQIMAINEPVVPGDTVSGTIGGQLEAGSAPKQIDVAISFFGAAGYLSGRNGPSIALAFGRPTTAAVTALVPSGTMHIAFIVDAQAGLGSVALKLDNASLIDTRPMTGVAAQAPSAHRKTWRVVPPPTVPLPTVRTRIVPTTVAPTAAPPVQPLPTTVVPVVVPRVVPVVAPATVAPGTAVAAGAGVALGVRVSGARFVDQAGAVVQLRGVNRPGTEYRCVSGSAGFTSDDGSGGQSLGYADTVVNSLRSWNRTGAATNAVNTVRIPLNEDCWLGINGVDPAYSGAQYQAFVVREVADLNAAGMYAILDLHWAAPGSALANAQDVYPDADHSVLFWQQVATEFKSDPAVMFDLFNEPSPSCSTNAACTQSYAGLVTWAWGCYRDGCTYTYVAADNHPTRTNTSFQVAGTQQLVNTIRAAGANNVIFIEGLGSGNSLDNWVKYLPSDPAGQLAPEWHEYLSSGGTYTSADPAMATAGIAGHYPLFIGEFGEADCGPVSGAFAAGTMSWADAKGYSWTAWGWDAGEGCNGPSLVTANDSAIPSVYGSVVKQRLQTDEH